MLYIRQDTPGEAGSLAPLMFSKILGPLYVHLHYSFFLDLSPKHFTVLSSFSLVVAFKPF